jgi:tight adherence protein C
MGIAVLTFSVVFLLIVSGGLLLFHREEMLQRISDVINPQRRQTEVPVERYPADGPFDRRRR